MSGVRHASAVHRETSEANRQELPAELADLHLRLHLGLREPHFIDRMIRAWRAMLDGTELELEFNMAVQNFVRMDNRLRLREHHLRGVKKRKHHEYLHLVDKHIFRQKYRNITEAAFVEPAATNR